MQIELTLKEVNQIQEGLKFLAGLKGDKKTSVPYEFRHNVMMWIQETQPELKLYNDMTNDLLDELGEKIYTKETVLNGNIGSKVTNYDENGNEKLVYWRQPIPPENMKEYNKRFDEMNSTKATIGKVKKIKETDLQKFEKDKITEPISAEILYSLNPILEEEKEPEE